MLIFIMIYIVIGMLGSEWMNSLNNLWGWCGELTALTGASGAGGTTLLNTLSQRQSVGVVTGDMLVDGKELGVEFRRGTDSSSLRSPI